MNGGLLCVVGFGRVCFVLCVCIFPIRGSFRMGALYSPYSGV